MRSKPFVAVLSLCCAITYASWCFSQGAHTCAWSGYKCRPAGTCPVGMLVNAAGGLSGSPSDGCTKSFFLRNCGGMCAWATGGGPVDQSCIDGAPTDTCTAIWPGTPVMCGTQTTYNCANGNGGPSGCCPNTVVAPATMPAGGTPTGTPANLTRCT